jgi:hypothetical protein
MRMHLARLHPRSVEQAMFHAALVVFALDALGSLWPAFHSWWESNFHWIVAGAVLADAWMNHKLTKRLEGLISAHRAAMPLAPAPAARRARRK